jgi:hypothetical protein
MSFQFKPKRKKNKMSSVTAIPNKIPLWNGKIPRGKNNPLGSNNPCTQIPIGYTGKLFSTPSSDKNTEENCSETKKSPKNKPHEGCFCELCKEYYPYAEPNQEDGTLVCYSCRIKF